MKRILGSIVSVVVGWLVCTLVWAVGAFIFTLRYDDLATALMMSLVYALYAGLICGAFVIVTWFAVFVWIYLYLAPESCFWTWWRAALLGVAVGAVVVVVPFLVIFGFHAWGLLIYALSAALTGAVSASFAALTRPFFFKP